MIIYVLRHGEASYSYESDSARALTSRGCDQIQRRVTEKKDELASLSSILHSPLVRAQQSAEILGAAAPGVPLQSVDWLKPDTQPASVIQKLYLEQANAGWSRIALVTHLPFASSFIEVLCGLPAGAIAMGTGTMVAMETDVIAAGCARFLWRADG